MKGNIQEGSLMKESVPRSLDHLTRFDIYLGQSSWSTIEADASIYRQIIVNDLYSGVCLMLIEGIEKWTHHLLLTDKHRF